MDEQDISCPICAYQFSTPDKVPKLLPCYHTFCSPCIDNIIASTPSNSDSTIKCPVCRQTAIVPKSGVEGFFDNYIRSAPQQEKTCDICGVQNRRKLQYCNECGSLLCNSCHSSHHHHQSKTKHGTFDEDEDDSDGESHGDSRFMQETGKHYLNSVKTAFFGFRSATFKCNNFESVRKIITSSKNECWVLTNRRFVAKFSRGGQEMYRKYVNNVPQDIARHSNGSLVLAFPSGKLMILDGHDLRRVLNTGNNAIPSAIYSYQDGRLLIASQNSYQKICKLSITDQAMRNAYPLDVNVDLREVPSITVNEKSGQIALCETSKKCVYLLDHNSKMRRCSNIKSYDGMPNLLRMDQTEESFTFSQTSFFQPRSVTCDQNDNFYVLDAGTNLIHVLNEDANLQAVVLVKIPGNINCFNVDPFENLWIGDMSGQIWVFRMELRNFLDQSQRSRNTGTLTDLGELLTGLSGSFRGSVPDLSRLRGLPGGLGVFEADSAATPERTTSNNFIRNVF